MVELLTILRGCCTIQLYEMVGGSKRWAHSIVWEICGNVLIDEVNFQVLNQHRWLKMPVPSGGSYCAFRKEYQGGKQTTIYMAREVLNLSRNPGHGNDVADHKNHDTRDNREENLRVATSSQSSMNIRRYGSSQGFQGIIKNTNGGQYLARICIEDLRVCLHSVPKKVEAALMYNYGADLVFGEYACLNVISDDEMPTLERQWELYDMVIAKLREKNVPFDESRVSSRV